MDQILIDVTRIVGRLMEKRLPTGVDRVSLEYIRHFASQSTALIRYSGRWLELSENDSQKLFQAILTPPKHLTSLVRWLVGKSLPQRQQHKFAKPRILFNTGHTGLEKKTYSKRLHAYEMRPVFFVHDLIPITHPEYCRPGEAEKHCYRIETMLKLGHGLIVNSMATQEELVQYASNNKITLPPIQVAALAPGFGRAKKRARPLKEAYFVMLGTIEPRKNHWLILQVWRQLIEDHGLNAPKLVIIGQRGWECENVVDLLERCATLKEFVIELPNCHDAELVNYLTHAQALLFPSFVEGYGMPLAEALALNVPVIASDLKAFREISSEIPEYLNPLDGIGWKKTILDYAVDSSARNAQIARLRNFKPTTWAEHFSAVEQLLAQLSTTP